MHGEKTAMGLRRRALLKMGAAAGAVMALPWGTAAEAAAATGRPAAGPGAALPRRFAEPSPAVRPKFRWWWPDALVDTGEIEREIDQIAAAGFGGVEIAAVTHSLSEPVDPALNGWGTPAWVRAVEAALRRAAKRDVTVDLTIGPAWPAAVPSITPDSPGAIKELAHGRVTVTAGQTYTGPVPEPGTEPATGVTARELLLVQAVRVAEGSSPTAQPVLLDRGTVTDITASVEDGGLTWAAPEDGGTWLVIAYWERGSGQRPEGPDHTAPAAYVVDHFAASGTRAVTGFWERHILTPQVRKLLRETGGALFEDSLELETDETLWTPEFPAEFEKRTGYSVLPYLATVVERDEDPVFGFGPDVDKAVRLDVLEVFTDLYVENHLTPLQEWAHGLGLRLRVQPYGPGTDSMYASALLDITEGESLGFKNPDDFRCLAGGRDMGGKLILSDEAGATAGGAYATAWDATLKKLVIQYAAGVNQAVFHGFGYAEAPGAAWPGFAAFSPYHGGSGYGDAWGPRQPTWGHVPAIAGYLSRTQQILQTGVNRADIGILRQQGPAGTGLGAPWFTAEGVPVGWTHLFLSPRLLELPAAKVRGGRLAPDGPGFKALVFEGDVLRGKEHTLQIDVAQKLIGYARAGLPVIVIGNWSDARVPGLPGPGDNNRLRALLAELTALPKVRVVADRPDVPQAIAALGIRRDVEYAQSSMLVHAHRADGDADYYFFANDAVSKKGSNGTPISHDVTLAAPRPDAVPYRLDAWTGSIEPLPLYSRTDDGRIRLRVSLEPGATTVIALVRPGAWDGAGVGAGLGVSHRYATDSEAEAVRRGAGGRLEIRDTRAGTFRTTLQDRGTTRTVTTTLGGLPEPMPLTHWELTVEDWQPGTRPSQTVKERRELVLDGLRAWPEIPELLDSSGVGRYRTTVHLDAPWTGGYGAHLELGEVFDTFRVTVNGHRLPPADQLTPKIDLAPHLRRGSNTIEVEVATTLLNRLRVANAPVFGGAKRQNYGLVGPVRLVPYGRAALER
ncbi:glycosyl hydrolase [Streptomyces sp. NBC_01217]|uniref:glycosyl hydrolase n=1 Tax=Streptomyces sp. NBC_01217 TaxID=2903779 RepID=UPI002E15F062|nr:glycosyl hydrolase [Streptomyces sp. NBC_01217]